MNLELTFFFLGLSKRVREKNYFLPRMKNTYTGNH